VVRIRTVQNEKIPTQPVLNHVDLTLIGHDGLGMRRSGPSIMGSLALPAAVLQASHNGLYSDHKRARSAFLARSLN
jgi:hypothetical protein